MKLVVNEIFYSLQGEGARAGFPSIFIRLAYCDLSCGFCDTEFNSGKELSVEEIFQIIREYPCKDIVWTGGEPTLQLTEKIVDYFHSKGYFQCIETNGNNKPPKNIDWITLSPKVAEHILVKNFPDGVDEIKFVRHKGHLTVPQTEVKADYYYISPQSDGNQINKANLEHCIKLVKDNPKWKLTCQYHKIWKVN